MLLLFLVGLTAVASQEIRPPPVQCPTCIKVDNICHNISHLLQLQASFRTVVVITELGILRSKNILFYAFEPNITDKEYYKVGYVNLDNFNETGVVVGASAVNLITFDIIQSNGTIYYGGGDALYVSDKFNTVHFFGSKADRIRSVVVYKNEVHFVRDGEGKIVKKQGDNFKIYDLYTSVKNFLINKEGNMFFLNNSGLYLNRFETDLTVRLSKNNFFRGLTMDLNENFYAWWIDGIYKVVKGRDFLDAKLVRVADIPNIGAMTFDNGNNFLFTTSKSLFKLTSTNDADVRC
ncbi:uncharacterized protein LOC113236335 [Hyposmocoma kahamanoa]|uniref:uncharacterized protein LOC113236335 n=1 Tax=Hyposmocoma kahamanoa TaxID=1477025 RepID=UPI000E6D7C47|nr:uncharacterized protein LOC113236335 [Hyposmocoma kahamanoa]